MKQNGYPSASINDGVHSRLAEAQGYVKLAIWIPMKKGYDTVVTKCSEKRDTVILVMMMGDVPENPDRVTRKSIALE